MKNKDLKMCILMEAFKWNVVQLSDFCCNTTIDHWGSHEYFKAALGNFSTIKL